MVEGVGGHADRGAGGVGGAVDDGAAGEDEAGYVGGDGGRLAEGLVEDGAEVGELVERGVGPADGVRGGEGGADLGLEFGEARWIAEEVEEGGGEGGGGGVGAGEDEEVALGLELALAVAAAGFGVFFHEEIVEEIAWGFEAGASEGFLFLAALGEDGFAAGLKALVVADHLAAEEIADRVAEDEFTEDAGPGVVGDLAVWVLSVETVKAVG